MRQKRWERERGGQREGEGERERERPGLTTMANSVYGS